MDTGVSGWLTPVRGIAKLSKRSEQGPLGDVLQESLEHSGTDGILKFSYRLGLDLPNPFPGDLEYPADFFQRVRESIGQPVPEPDDFAFSVG